MFVQKTKHKSPKSGVKAPISAFLLLIACVSVVTAAPVKQSAADSPVLLVESPYSLEQTIERVKAAATGHNFRFIREQSMDYGFVTPEQETARRRIIYFCDFGFLNSALQIDRHIGMFLPCQVNVIEVGNKVYIVAPKPKILSAEFFDNPKLSVACDKLQTIYSEILEEAIM